MNLKVKILAENLDFPEGPAFDCAGNLWCVEVKGGNLVRWNHKEIQRFPTGGAPNGLVFDQKNNAWFCDSEQNAIRIFNSARKEFRTIIDTVNGERLNKPNDLTFDSQGNLLFTCPGDSRTEPTGYICCLSKEGNPAKVWQGMYFPNGLAFTDHGRTLVVAETYQQRLWKGKWDSYQAQFTDFQPWSRVDGPMPMRPDGITFSSDGSLYVAVFDSGQIQIFDREGVIINKISLPGQQPTNVTFDPSGQLGLVVTEVEHGLLLSITEVGPGRVFF